MTEACDGDIRTVEENDGDRVHRCEMASTDRLSAREPFMFCFTITSP
jgi:hypothetical protein